MPLGQVIDLGEGARAIAVAVGGAILGNDPPPYTPSTLSDNDQSIALLIQYNGFDYITAGDLGGGQWSADNACTGRSTTQKNMESPLATSLMPGGGAGLLTASGIEVLHVNHHGSESSTNHEWMNLLTPAVAVIHVGAGQGSFEHPRKDVVENVLLAGGPCITAPPALVLQTEEGAPIGSKTSLAGFTAGDLVIKVKEPGKFEVSGTGAVSQGPDERILAGIEPPKSIPFDP